MDFNVAQTELPEEVLAKIASLQEECQASQQTIQKLESKLKETEEQLSWFKRQIFGRKSEERIEWSESNALSCSLARCWMKRLEN